MKKTLIWIALILIVVVGSSTLVITEPSIKVDCYLYDYCGGCGSDGGCGVCEVEKKYKKKYRDMIKSGGFEGVVEFTLINTAYYGDEYLKTLLKEQGLSDDTEMPIVFVEDDILYTDEQIENELFSTIEENLSLPLKIKKWLTIDLPQTEIYDTVNDIVYFSMEGCPDCVVSDAYLEELGEKLGIDVYEDIKIIYIGGDEPPENRALLQDMYNLYDRDDDLWVPTIFINDKSLIAIDEIEEFFDDYNFDENIETKVTVGFEYP